MFAELDPKKIAESDSPLQDVLHENLVKAVKELDGSAIGDPLEVAAMQDTLGKSLVSLGEYGLAIEVLAKVMETRKAKFRQLDKSVPLFEELLPLRMKKPGHEHPDTQVRHSAQGAGSRRT